MFNMLVTANRTFPVIIIMLTCVAANRANTRRRVVSMPRSIGISANFASMRTLVLMRRMLVIAYRARAVFVNMFGRFMRRAADRANMIDVVFVVGMLEAANGACTAFVIMFALFTAHGALTCCRVVIVRGHGMTADDTSMQVFKVMFGMLVTANRTFPAIINMLANFSANST